MTLCELLEGSMKASIDPDAFREIETETRVRLFSVFVWARLALVPVIITLIAWIGLSDSARWRHIVMVCVIVALVSVSLWDVYQFSRRGVIGNFAVLRTVFGAGLATLVIIFATGAIESPILPVTLIVALVSTLIISPALGRVVVIALQIPAVWFFAVASVYELIPSSGAHRPRHALPRCGRAP